MQNCLELDAPAPARTLAESKTVIALIATENILIDLAGIERRLELKEGMARPVARVAKRKYESGSQG